MPLYCIISFERLDTFQLYRLLVRIHMGQLCLWVFKHLVGYYGNLVIVTIVLSRPMLTWPSHKVTHVIMLKAVGSNMLLWFIFVVQTVKVGYYQQ